ncbi:MAG: hypothetical protein L0Z48_09660 [candidate division Zixibacteria bacterium]|nr:hypothetical protein [candidate division Zixibacteria bacterium]MCI0596786.1 hypothetical protein [candidate division Zixibacteria bacterium]
MNRWIFPLPFLAALTFAGRAQASCGASICPLDLHKSVQAGRLQLTISHEYINQNRINVGSKKSFVGALPNAHDEVTTINQRTLLQAQYGFSNAFGVNVELPYIIREHSHIEDSALEAFNFEGFGDAGLTGQYGFNFGSVVSPARFDFVAGIKIPTGLTSAANEDGEQAEPTIQPGTGSWDGIFGANLQIPLFTIPSFSGGLYGKLPLNVGVSYRLNGKGIDDYQFGNQVLAHIGTEYQIFPRLSLLFQANARWQDFADVGTTGEFRSNTGGTYIFASPGLSFQFNNALSAYSYAQIPVYQKVNGIQQVAKLNLQFGLTADVKLPK